MRDSVEQIFSAPSQRTNAKRLEAGFAEDDSAKELARLPRGSSFQTTSVCRLMVNPAIVAWLIIGQSFGGGALISGFLARFAAGGPFIIFTGALIVHSPDGWTLNWHGNKEYVYVNIS